LYDNSGEKNDASAFVKASYDVGRVRWFADLQARHARFTFVPDPAAGVSERTISWNFFNPKAGVTVQLPEGLSAFASWGATTREPARSDLFAGDDDLNSGNVDVIGDFHRVHPESVRDAEAGLTLRRPSLELQVNAYVMNFHNSIERVGAPTASGLIPRRNVGRVIRTGVEFDATWRATPRLRMGANAWMSRNRIRQFTDSTVDPVVVRHNVAPLLTPSFVTVHRAEFTPTPALSFGIEGRYQGKAFLDNTGNESRTLPASYLIDSSVRWNSPRYALVLRGVNLTDNQKYGSGSVSSDGTVRYFVLAGRSVFLTAELRF
jgi:iron complex outermembrane receptor protein